MRIDSNTLSKFIKESLENNKLTLSVDTVESSPFNALQPKAKTAMVQALVYWLKQDEVLNAFNIKINRTKAYVTVVSSAGLKLASTEISDFTSVRSLSIYLLHELEYNQILENAPNKDSLLTLATLSSTGKLMFVKEPLMAPYNIVKNPSASKAIILSRNTLEGIRHMAHLRYTPEHVKALAELVSFLVSNNVNLLNTNYLLASLSANSILTKLKPVVLDGKVYLAVHPTVGSSSCDIYSTDTRKRVTDKNLLQLVEAKINIFY